jgi:hypothetical protein
VSGAAKADAVKSIVQRNAGSVRDVRVEISIVIECRN